MTLPLRPEIFRDKAGEWRWHVKAGNEEIVAASGEGFTTEEHAREGLKAAGYLTDDGG